MRDVRDVRYSETHWSVNQKSTKIDTPLKNLKWIFQNLYVQHGFYSQIIFDFHLLKNTNYSVSIEW